MELSNSASSAYNQAVLLRRWVSPGSERLSLWFFVGAVSPDVLPLQELMRVPHARLRGWDSGPGTTRKQIKMSQNHLERENLAGAGALRCFGGDLLVKSGDAG